MKSARGALRSLKSRPISHQIQIRSIGHLPSTIRYPNPPISLSRTITVPKYYRSRRNQSSTTTSLPSTRPCPSCSTPLSPSISPCPSCSTLIPLPPNLSHHSLLSVCQPIPTSDGKSFDIPAELSTLPASGFDLQPRELRNRMLSRQRDLHPDKFGSGGEGIVGLARDLSGRVNRAYEVLADPLKRAEYIVCSNLSG